MSALQKMLIDVNFAKKILVDIGFAKIIGVGFSKKYW